MSADLLDDILVEVTSVAQQRITNAKGVLHAKVIRLGQTKERPLLQLIPLRTVDVLHPAVMSRSRIRRDVLLEDDDIGVRDLRIVHGGENGGSTIVNGVHDHRRRGRKQREQRKAEEALHDGNRMEKCSE